MSWRSTLSHLRKLLLGVVFTSLSSCPKQLSLPCPKQLAIPLRRTKDKCSHVPLRLDSKEWNSPPSPLISEVQQMRSFRVRKNLFYQTHPIVCSILVVSWCWLEFGDSNNTVGSNSASWLVLRLLSRGQREASNRACLANKAGYCKAETLKKTKMSKIKNAFINAVCASLNSGSLQDYEC